MLDGLESPLKLLDHESVDWDRVRRTSYLVDQVLRYEYPGPVQRLNQRLVVFPPEQFGQQRLQGRHLQVSGPQPRLREEIDHFGNQVCHLLVPRTERIIEFEIRFLVERNHDLRPLDPAEMSDLSYREPSPLTLPDARLTEAAAELARGGEREDLAERVNRWIWRTLTYTRDVTSVQTTAAEAFALGAGVCQDYAHIMISLCRLLDMPARYVSGHLLGEGATHAWVEVLAPDPNRASRQSIQAFDPTHGRRCRADYITVAVGRDYTDVAPTSGTFAAPYGGTLSSRKAAGLIDIEYFATETD
ncbi:MAG: transglutaminase domain-containing protein [Chloroflexota bacterium]